MAEPDVEQRRGFHPYWLEQGPVRGKRVGGSETEGWQDVQTAERQERTCCNGEGEQPSQNQHHAMVLEPELVHVGTSQCKLNKDVDDPSDVCCETCVLTHCF